VGNMKLSVIAKVRPLTKRKRQLLDSAIEEFKNCVNDWLNAIDSIGSYSRTKLHKQFYKCFREKYQLMSGIISMAMITAIEIYKSWLAVKGKKKPEFTSDCMYISSQNVKIKENGIVIPTFPRQRLFLPLHLSDYHKRLLKHKHGRVIVQKRNDNEYYVFIPVEVPVEQPYEPQGFLGVDFGYYNIITVVDEQGKLIMQISGEELINRKIRYEEQRARRQKRLAKRFGITKPLGHKDRNFVHDLNHKIAKQLVLTAKQLKKALVIENLKGLKQNVKHKGKRIRKVIQRWPYADLIDKIKYKATLYGVPVIEVDPVNTSKMCSVCGHINENLGSNRIFKCPKCGLVMDRDLNAAINIIRKIW